MSQIATDSIVLEGKDRVKYLSGKLAGSYYPGTCVYLSAADTWTQSAGTTATNYKVYGFVEFKKRTSSTFGEVDIDTAYTDGTAINVEIVVGPQDGTIKIAALCLNLSATKYFGHRLYATSGGKLDNHSEKYSFASVGYITEENYTSGDVVAKIYLHAGDGR
jgi:hypothetical protein